jgi:hypothetical protein
MDTDIGKILYLDSRAEISFNSVDEMITEFRNLNKESIHSGVIEFQCNPSSSIVFNQVAKEVLLNFAISLKDSEKTLYRTTIIDEKAV